MNTEVEKILVPFTETGKTKWCDFRAGNRVESRILF